MGDDGGVQGFRPMTMTLFELISMIFGPVREACNIREIVPMLLTVVELLKSLCTGFIDLLTGPLAP